MPFYCQAPLDIPFIILRKHVFSLRDTSPYREKITYPYIYVGSIGA